MASLKMETAFKHLKILLCVILILFGLVIMISAGHWGKRNVFTLLFSPIMSGLLIFAGFKLLKFVDSHKIRRLIKEYNDNAEFLKKNGELRVINHSSLIVGERSELVDKDYELFHSEMVIYDGLLGIDRSYKKKELFYSVIVFEEKQNGKSFMYISPEINKDSISLSFLLEKQSKINLYIDKKKKENYYFDLEFLKNNWHNT